MKRICLYFKQEPEPDRWFKGDHYIRPYIRRVIRGKPKFVSGVDRIFVNLCAGLDRLGVAYEVNLPFSKLTAQDRVGVVGRGPHVLKGYKAPNPIVAGPWLMTHPSQWPTLCGEYPVAKYLHHCDWCNEMFKKYFGDRCMVWPHGVDTKKWHPSTAVKDIDVLIYDKIRWERDELVPKMLQPIREALQRKGLKVAEIRYGHYDEALYREMLSRSRTMLFVVEHEAQGHACQECLSCDVPILAWDPGWWKDPERFNYGELKTPANSVPFFDDRCGLTYKDINDFEPQFDLFWKRLQEGKLRPREFVLENLTLEKCAQNYLEILEEVARSNHP